MKKEKFSEMREKIAERIPKREVTFQKYHTVFLTISQQHYLMHLINDHVMKGQKKQICLFNMIC